MNSETPWHVRHRWKTLGIALLSIPVAYIASAYEVAPSVWRLVERRHPALDVVETRVVTSASIPGDPLNISFVGDEVQLQEIMKSAQWLPADPITMRSSLRIAVDSVIHKPYPFAPVSDLYLFGRKQDLAFEQEAYGDPSTRHHVRFWRSAALDMLGRPLWLGAATYDASVGFSHTTGQITHHIGADVDAERNKLLGDLAEKTQVVVSWIDNFQKSRFGKNGGGDTFVTDRRMAVIQIKPQ